jgi:hypothetical protein
MTMFRVTCRLTKGGRRDPDDPVLWTHLMTHDEYDRWLAEEKKRIEDKLAALKSRASPQ